MKRLLFIIHYPIYGGPHNQAARLTGAMADMGWHMIVMLPDEPGNAGDRLRDAGVEVVSAPLHRLRARRDPRLHLRYAAGFAGDVRRIRRVIHDLDIDLVLVGGLVNPQGAIAARLAKRPLVWKIVDSRAPAPLRVVAMALVRRLAHVVMFDGQALEQLHVGTRRLPMPSRLYYPPVDTQSFRPDPDRGRAIRQSLGIPADAFVVGTVANVNPQKGVEYFVEAAALIDRVVPGVHFIVVGAHYPTHRDYSRRLERLVAERQLPASRFQFLGDRSNVQDFYNAMDVKLITSVPFGEGTTTTAMEAMSCGVPVIATDVGAIREVVEDGVTGVLVHPRNASALAEATVRLLREDETRRGMASAGRRRAQERYDIEHCARSHAEAFALATAGRS